MGAVYAARGPAGEAVAVKITRTRAELSQFELQLEIQALSDLQHPSVVGIVDQGTHEGLPWYAMPHLRGPTLRDVIAAHPQGLPVDRALSLGRALCSPLAYVHGKGLVHRDLKPENIFIEAGDRAVLVDFGLAGRFGSHGRERLERGGRQMGSHAYMAPEQVRALFVDARADLYALGCVLFELLTGRTPFGRSQDVLRRHLSEPAPMPSQYAEGIPTPVDALVQALLEKNPRHRIGYAQDVARRLCNEESSPAEPLEAPYLYRPELSGREGLLNRWLNLVDDALGDQGAAVLLSGESGVGKTRLSSEFGDQAVRAGLTVWLGECSEATASRGAPLLGAFASCLAFVGAEARRGAASARRLLGPGAAMAVALVPDWSDLEVHVGRPPPGTPAEQVLQAGLSSLADAILAIVETEPACLIIDDLQWADAPSIKLLERLVEGGLTDRGLLILGSYRMEEGHEVLRDLLEVAQLWELERLTPKETSEMIAGMLALTRAPTALAQFVAERTSGNPFFVAEYLRTAMQQRLLVRSPDGTWGVTADVAHDTNLPFPETLAALVDARLERLPPLGRRLAQLASILGRSAPAELLLELAELDAQEGLRTLELLRVQQIVEPLEDGDVRFVHDQIRAAAYRQPSAEQTRAWHARAGTAIDRRHPAAEAHAASIAGHFARGGAPAQAVRPYLTASAYAQKRYLPQDAINFAESAVMQCQLRTEEGSPPTFEVREQLADLLLPAGRLEEATMQFEAAGREVMGAAPETRARLHRKEGTVCQAAHAYEAALSRYGLAERALTLASPSPAREQEWLQLQMDRVATLYWTGRDRERAAVLRTIGPELTQRLPSAEQARFYQGLVQHGVRHDRYRCSEETVSHAHKVLELSEGTGNDAAALEARFGLGVALLWKGVPDEARGQLEPCLREAGRRGNRPLALRCEAYLATSARLLGWVDVAREHAERAQAEAIELDLADYRGTALAHRAWAAWRAGEATGAVTLAQEALTAWTELPMTYPFTWTARLVLLAVADGPEVLRQHAEALVSEDQQSLPQPLAEALERLRAAPSPSSLGARDTVIEVATEMHHL